MPTVIRAVAAALLLSACAAGTDCTYNCAAGGCIATPQGVYCP